MILFSEFLALGGLFDRLVETAHLVYTSPNAPEKRDVIGTAVLGIVDGAKRFRHFDSLTGDGVSAETLPMLSVFYGALQPALLPALTRGEVGFGSCAVRSPTCMNRESFIGTSGLTTFSLRLTGMLFCPTSGHFACL